MYGGCGKELRRFSRILKLLVLKDWVLDVLRRILKIWELSDSECAAEYSRSSSPPSPIVIAVLYTALDPYLLPECAERSDRPYVQDATGSSGINRYNVRGGRVQWACWKGHAVAVRGQSDLRLPLLTSPTSSGLRPSPYSIHSIGTTLSGRERDKATTMRLTSMPTQHSLATPLSSRLHHEHGIWGGGRLLN